MTCRDQLGRTPIQVAVECGNTQDIWSMVEERGDTSINRIVGEFANDALHHFVRKGKVPQLRALLSFGAIKDIPAKDGSTAFTIALGTCNDGEQSHSS